MSRLAGDLRVAMRTLTRSRFVSILAILAFALGIGVTTAVFAIFNGVLLDPLPFPHAGDIVAVYDTQPACATCPASFPKYVDWRDRNQVFSAIGAVTARYLTLTGRGDPLRVSALETTASFADVFEVRPAIGRWFHPDEEQPGGPHVAVLTRDFWVREFGADPHVVGTTATLDGTPYEIVGVMPPQFTFRRGDLLVPLQRKLDPAARGTHYLQVYARLKPGVTVERAATEMRALGRTLAREFGNNHGIDVRSYYEVVVGSVRTPLRVLLGAVFLVLLIACANVANLLLASGLARRRELAIRVALGAAQRDLLVQLTTESLLLAAVGGILGLVLAVWIKDSFVALAGTQLPRAATIAIDGRVLAFAAIVSAVVGVFCGVWPMLVIRMRELAALVREGDTRTGSGNGSRFGSGLVVAEVALSFTLLVGAGLLVKNLVQLRHRDAGIRTDRIVAFDLTLAGPQYPTLDRAVASFHELYDRLSRIGGVESAGLTSDLPMARFGSNGEFQIEGRSPWPPNEAPLVEYRWIYGEYLKTMGIPLVAGRMIGPADAAAGTSVLVNRAMAAKFWPGQDPIGKRFGQGDDRAKWFEVVGVVGDVRSYGLAVPAPYEFYRTIDESPASMMTVVIRTTAADPTTIVPTARRIVAETAPAAPVAQVRTMTQVVDESVSQPRLFSALTTLFGALAGVLAAVGIYGVMAYNVRRQRRELGIRVALGADPARVRNDILGRGLMLAASGLAIGVAGALILTRLLSSLLNDVKPTDPAVFAGMAIAIVVVTAFASYMPARAAARVDPMVVLRDA